MQWLENVKPAELKPGDNIEVDTLVLTEPAEQPNGEWSLVIRLSNGARLLCDFPPDMRLDVGRPER